MPSLNRFIPLHLTSSGAVPTASDMAIGELATNIADGTLFMRSGSQVLLMAAVNAISASYAQTSSLVNATSASYAQTSSVTATATSSSYALTASYALNGGSGGGSSSTGSYIENLRVGKSGQDTGSLSGSLNIIGNAGGNGQNYVRIQGFPAITGDAGGGTAQLAFGAANFNTVGGPVRNPFFVIKAFGADPFSEAPGAVIAAYSESLQIIGGSLFPGSVLGISTYGTITLGNATSSIIYDPVPPRYVHPTDTGSALYPAMTNAPAVPVDLGTDAVHFPGFPSIITGGQFRNIYITGYLTGSAVSASAGFYGNLTGTASLATSASYALSASWAPGGGAAVSASYALTASYANTSSYAVAALSASYAPGAPSVSASYSITASAATSITFVPLTASYALNAGATGGGLVGSGTSGKVAVWAGGAISSSIIDDNGNRINIPFPLTASAFQGNGAQVTNVTASVLSVNGVQTWTTPSLAAQASYTSSLPLSQRAIVLSVSSSVYSRIRLYNTTANRDADLTRSTGSFASASSGLLLDVVASGSIAPNGQIVYLSPPAIVYGGTLTPTGSVGITITNLTAATVTLSGSVTYLAL